MVVESAESTRTTGTPQAGVGRTSGVGGHSDGDRGCRVHVLHAALAHKGPEREEEEDEHGAELAVVDHLVGAVEVEGDEQDHQGLAQGGGPRDEKGEAYKDSEVCKAEVVRERREDGGEGAVAVERVAQPRRHEGHPRGEEQEAREEGAEEVRQEEAQREGHAVKDVAYHREEEHTRGAEEVEELDELLPELLPDDLHRPAVPQARGHRADVEIEPENGNRGPNQEA
mmetsp:Transcript_4477/g.14886  ORF Transcript_4477/g.14886 Transcript_4477/m.14886 type:complete len:227 (-) Transcript_4477:915-1595(-)